MVFCSSCGIEVTPDVKFCPKCGKDLQSQSNPSPAIDGPKRKRSRWWFLLPIFFSVVGGIIAYFVLKDDDKRLAKNCLYLGILLTVIGFVIGIIFGAIFGIAHQVITQ
jgi:CDP-diglyceride synthetase